MSLVKIHQTLPNGSTREINLNTGNVIIIREDSKTVFFGELACDNVKTEDIGAIISDMKTGLANIQYIPNINKPTETVQIQFNSYNVLNAVEEKIKDKIYYRVFFGSLPTSNILVDESNYAIIQAALN